MFKDKKFVRRLALVLCLSLVVGILPIGVLNAPVQINAVSDNLIADGSFEEGKWNTGAALVLVDDAATGAKSMQMNAGKGGVGTTQMLDASIAAFEVYELSFMYKHAIGRAPYIGVWFFKDQADNDHFVDASVIYPADQSGEWVKVALEVVVPNGANIAQLQIGYNSDSKSEDPTSSCQIDDLSLVKIGKYAFIEKFEDMKSMAAKGWTASNNFSGSAVSTYANYYQGTKSLFLQAGGAWTKSPAFAVEAGNTYTAEFYAMKSSAKDNRSDGVQLVFLDENGAELDKVEMAMSIVNKEWKKQTLTGTAPAGAVSAQLVYTLGSASGDYGIDDLYVAEIEAAKPEETTPTETEPSTPASEGLLANGGFESGKDGWKGGEAIEILDADVFEGSYAAVIPASSAAVYMQSEKFAAVPGETYHLSVMAKRLSGEKVGYIGFWYVDENGAYVGAGATTINYSADEWTKYTMDWTVPAGVASFWVEFGVSSKANTSFVVDNIVVTKDAELAKVPVFAENFDSNNSDAKLSAAGWTANENFSASNHNIGVYNTAYEGCALWMQQTSSAWAKTPAIAAVPGATYTVNVLTNGSEGAASMKLIFVDAAGNVLAEKSESIGTGAAWAEETVTAVAPENTANVYVYFDRNSSDCGIDNLAVFEELSDEQPTEATEPSTEATEPSTEATEPAKTPVFAESFDSNNSDAKLSAAGWTASENFDNKNHNIGVFDTAYEGSALWMQQTSSAWAKTPAIAAVPGATYTVNVLTNGSEGAASMKLIFVDAAGNVLAESEEAIGTGAAWAEETVTAVAPENTANVYVYFDRGAKDCGIDNLEVYMTEGAAPEVTEPSTEATEPSTEATEPSEPAGNLVFSDKFEEHNLYEYTNSAGNPATNRIPKGWTSFDPANIRAACNKGYFDVYEGYNLFFQEAKGDKWVKSPLFDVVAGNTYTANFMDIKMPGTIGTGGYAAIVFVDAAGNVLATQTAAAGLANTWGANSVAATAPAGAVAAYVEFGLKSATGNPEFAVDNLEVYMTEGAAPEATEPSGEATEPSTEATEPTEAPIFTDTFENAYTPDGAAKTVHIPVGWTASVQSAAIGTAGYDKYDGTLNLCVQDPKNKWIKSPLIEVIEGYEYTAEYVEKKYQPAVAGNGGYVKIVFVDANGNILKEYSQNAGTSAEWTNKILVSKAPAGATHMYVEFGLLNPTGEPTYSVDNLAVYAYEAEVGGAEPTMPTEPIPTEPEGPVKFGADFETLADASTGNAGPLGWISSDDANGAYSAAISVGTFGMEYDGNFLCLQTPGQWSIKSTKFAAAAGYEYEIKFMARKLVDNTNYTGALKVVFLDAYGNITGEVTETVGKTFGAWTAESVKALAPNGTVAAYLEFSLDNADRKTKGDYGIDNLEVFKSAEPVFVPEDPTEPSNPSNPSGGNTNTGDSVVLLPVFGVMAAVVALAVLVIKKRRFF